MEPDVSSSSTQARCGSPGAAIGVSIQNGVILLSEIIRRKRRSDDLNRAIMKGALNKLRPVLAASLVAILGLLPAALSNGIGAQSQKPFAISIMGGLLVGTAFTIFLIPLLFKIAMKENNETVS